jgi:Epoxide hydrolase N terminus
LNGYSWAHPVRPTTNRNWNARIVIYWPVTEYVTGFGLGPSKVASTRRQQEHTGLRSLQSNPMLITPFEIRVSDEVLSDLRTRIRNTRWPAAAPGAAWGQGTDREYLKALLSYWANDFDWRAQERHRCRPQM